MENIKMNSIIENLNKYIEYIIDKLNSNEIDYKEWITACREFEGALIVNVLDVNIIRRFANAIANANIDTNLQTDEIISLLKQKQKILKFISVLDSNDYNAKLISIYKNIEDKPLLKNKVKK